MASSMPASLPPAIPVVVESPDAACAKGVTQGPGGVGGAGATAAVPATPQDSFELLRQRLVLFAKVQVGLGILMIPLTWSWLVAVLAWSSGFIMYRYLWTGEKAGQYFREMSTRASSYNNAALGSGCMEPSNLRMLSLIIGVVAAVHTLSFLIASATVGSWLIEAANARDGVAWGNKAWAGNLRYQAAMLVFGVLFSLAQAVLAAGVYKTYSDLVPVAFNLYPPATSASAVPLGLPMGPAPGPGPGPTPLVMYNIAMQQRAVAMTAVPTTAAATVVGSEPVGQPVGASK